MGNEGLYQPFFKLFFTRVPLEKINSCVCVPALECPGGGGKDDKLVSVTAT